MDYKLVLSFYKSFCTKITDLKRFFRNDSILFFIGDSGNSFIAYGEEDIEQHIERQFWTKEDNNFDKTLIAYNINIETKTQMICPKTSSQLYDKVCDGDSNGVAVVVIGTLNAIHSKDDIPLTKTMGRRFVQTFSIKKCEENYIQSSVFAFLAPTTDFFNTFRNTEVTPSLPPVSGDIFVEKQSKDVKEDNQTNQDFERIVKSIDKLMEENIASNEEMTEEKADSNSKELMPISVDELIDDNTSNKEIQEINESFSFEEYFKGVWTQNKANETEISENEKKKILDKSVEYKSKEMTTDHNSGISFADVLRDGLQSWQSVKTENKPQEIRIITNCSKSKFKQSCLKTSGDRKQDFYGQQNITIIGAQNLEDFLENQILFVANIPIGSSKNEFRNLFDIYRKVLSIKFVERIGVSFAFIYFDSSKSVDEVINSTAGNNNLYLSGHQLKVDRYRARVPVFT